MRLKTFSVIAVASLLALFLNRPVWGEGQHLFDESGNMFKDQCIDRPQNNDATDLACTWYVIGLAEGMGASKSVTYFNAESDAAEFAKKSGTSEATHGASKEGPPPCYPSGGVRNDQKIDVLKNFISNHPEDRHNAVAIIALIACAQAWSCDAKQPFIFPEARPVAVSAPIPSVAPAPIVPKETCLGDLCFHLK
jgi:hypothetical protein